MSDSSESEFVESPSSEDLTREAYAPPLSQSAAGEGIRKAAMSGVAVLGLLAAIHFLVDTVAGTVSPLWPKLEGHYSLPEGGIFWVFLVWQMSTSITQFLFGYLGDRFSGRWLLWAGPAVGIICLGSIGLTDSPIVGGLLLMFGGLGIAAFHPEAASLAGASVPGHRSRAMSLFAIGGYFGQSVGPLYSGTVAKEFGLHNLAWGIAVGLVVLLFLAVNLRRVPKIELNGKSQRATSLRDMLRGRLAAVTVLITISTLRVIGAIGIPLAVAFLLADRGSDTARIGLIQTGFMAGIGLGGLACALLVNRRKELPVMLWMPLLVAPVILLVPQSDSNVFMLSTMGASGLLIGVVLPVQISIGQQLLPEGQRVASSLTMGVSWGIGGVVVAGAMHLFKLLEIPAGPFYVFAAASVASAVLSIWLPRGEEK